MFFWSCLFSFLLINIGLLGLIKNPVMQVVVFICIISGFSVIIIYGLYLDLIGLILIIVYIGAISVLFLFIVMMLNIRIIEITSIFWGYMSISVFYFCIIFFEFSQFYIFKKQIITYQLIFEDLIILTFSNIELIAFIFFNYQVIWLLILTIILLIAMVGSIILTHKITIRTKKQNIVIQSTIFGWQSLQLKNLCIY